MSLKGHRYAYKLKTILPQEYEAVNFAYYQAGWKEVDSIPDDGIPTHIIFEWTRDGPPVYPVVNFP